MRFFGTRITKLKPERTKKEKKKKTLKINKNDRTVKIILEKKEERKLV